MGKIGAFVKKLSDFAGKVDEKVLLPIGNDILTAPERAVRGTIRGLQDTPGAVMANIRMLQKKGTKQDVDTLNRFNKNSTDAIQGAGTLASLVATGQQFAKTHPNLTNRVSSALSDQRGFIDPSANVDLQDRINVLRKDIDPDNLKLSGDTHTDLGQLQNRVGRAFRPEDFGVGEKASSETVIQASRPSHQKLLEQAYKIGDRKEVGKILDSIPKGDPYKEPMEHLFRSFVTGEKSTTPIVKTSGIITKNDIAKAEQAGKAVANVVNKTTTKFGNGIIRKEDFLNAEKLGKSIADYMNSK